MYQIQCLNKISEAGTSCFGPDYVCGTDVQNPEAILVRSASMHEMAFGPDNPFLCADRILREARGQYDLAVCEIHAGATSEKLAMGFYLDGRCCAVYGTHTHVQTADARVNPKGTGYITDLGMTGPVWSVLGVEPAQSVAMFRGDLTEYFRAAPGETALMGAVFDIDEATGRCRAVTPVCETMEG